MSTNNEAPALHLTLSMNQIKKERAACATILRALRPLSPRKAEAVLNLAVVCVDEQEPRHE